MLDIMKSFIGLTSILGSVFIFAFLFGTGEGNFINTIGSITVLAEDQHLMT